MAGPPAGVEPSELWTKITQLPRPHELVDFPRKDPVTKEPSIGKVAIWVLTESECHACRAQAGAVAKQLVGDLPKGTDLAYEDIYRNELIVQLVCASCRTPEDLRVPAFPTPKLARQMLTTDEFGVLFEAYCTFRAESGPVVAELEKAEMDAWVKKLQEGGSRLPLALLSSDAVKDLLMHSVALLKRSQTGSGSPGSQPDESSSGPPKAEEMVDPSELPVLEATS